MFKNKKRASQRKAAKSKMASENKKYVRKNKKKSVKYRKWLLRAQNNDNPAADNYNIKWMKNSKYAEFLEKIFRAPETKNNTDYMERIALFKKH